MISLRSRWGWGCIRRWGSTWTSESEEKTHFGFNTINTDEKTDKVQEVFSRVSSKYDLMNDAMSLGIHRCWKDSFVSLINPDNKHKIIDVASGTGDIALRIINHAQRNSINNNTNININRIIDPKSIKNHVGDSISKEGTEKEKEQKIGNPDSGNVNKTLDHVAVTCTDLNASMLNTARERLRHLPNVSFKECNAESLQLESESFDVYSIAFGIRNVTHIDKALKEAFRVLKPGGRFVCLEFSHVDNWMLDNLYELYSFQMIPVLGKVIAGDWDSYEYLVQSIRRFPDQESFKAMIEEAGFRAVSYTNLNQGIAAIHSGFKLERPSLKRSTPVSAIGSSTAEIKRSEMRENP